MSRSQAKVELDSVPSRERVGDLSPLLELLDSHLHLDWCDNRARPSWTELDFVRLPNSLLAGDLVRGKAESDPYYDQGEHNALHHIEGYVRISGFGAHMIGTYDDWNHSVDDDIVSPRTRQKGAKEGH